jgi:organic radical activating enzyme
MTEAESEQLDKGLMLPVMEQFYTLQGEGAHTGRAAYFVRVGGCDVGCHWCDVKESWNADLHPLTAIADIVAPALQMPARTMVITGGEPSIYNLYPLCQMLHSQGFQVHIETSGAYPLRGEFDWVCLSPKKTAPPLPMASQMAHELKVIIHNRNDLKWAEEHAATVRPSCQLFVQPEWSKRAEMMPLAIDFVQNDPRWRISLQSHKYMNIP